MAVLDRITNGDIQYLVVNVDPSAGGGQAAAIGSFAHRDNAGAGELYFKFAAADTSWELVRSGLVDLTSEVTGVLPVTNGGTGFNASTVTDGQILIGDDAANGFDLTTLTAGTNISIVNGAGSITINNTAAGAATVANVSTTDATVTTIATISLAAADTVTMVAAKIYGIVTGGAGGNDQRIVTFVRTFSAKNDGGVVTLEQTQSDQTFKETALAAYAVSGSISGTNLLLRVMGGATDNVNWETEYVTSAVA